MSDLAGLYDAQDEFQWTLRLADRALEGCVRVLGLSYRQFIVRQMFDIVVGKDGAALQSFHTVGEKTRLQRELC